MNFTVILCDYNYCLSVCSVFVQLFVPCAIEIPWCVDVIAGVRGFVFTQNNFVMWNACILNNSCRMFKILLVLLVVGAW